MRSLLVAAPLALAASIALAPQAGAQTFGFTGFFQTWTAPTTGDYFITARGAQGGHGTMNCCYVGGRGAQMAGLFSFTAGTTLQLAVGGMGSSIAGNYNGGGGGGSFVIIGGTPILIGGGGGGIRSYSNQNGFDASITAYGKKGTCGSPSGADITKTDDLGMGGDAPCSSWGSAGAGFFGDGQVDPYASSFVTAAQDYSGGLIGGAGTAASHCTSFGGFGGGGSGTGCGGGGGGGGYSGGDAGWVAGGGGSWNLGSAQVNTAGVGYGDGMISIVARGSVVPEPATVTLMLTGLMGVGVAVRRRNRGNKAA